MFLGATKRQHVPKTNGKIFTEIIKFCYVTIQKKFKLWLFYVFFLNCETQNNLTAKFPECAIITSEHVDKYNFKLFFVDLI